VRPDSASADPTRYENDDESPRRVPFAQRRAAGYRAYHEYLPRPPAYDYGAIPLGAHATLFLTDERGHRSAQPCRDATAQACPEATDPRLTLLGAAQKRWFKRALQSDRATWKLWANEVMAMPLDIAPGVPLYVDQWDGYQAEREEILQHVVSHGIRNLTALTGDIHTFFAGELKSSDGTPGGVEFCGGSISSPGFDERVTAARLPAFEANLLAQNPHITYADTSRRGYMLVTAAHDALSVEFRSPATTLAPAGPVTTLARFTVPSGSHEVTKT
jgi:alkaline phosphatase D